MSSVGNISLDLNINKKGFNKQVDGIQKSTTKAFNTMSIAIGNIVSDMVTKAISGIGNFVKDSINAGSEIAELANVVDSVFTTMSDKVDTFAQSALNSYGLTEKQAKKMVGTFGAMSKSFGYSEKQAYDMSTALTGLAGDVASFYNLDHDVAYTKMKSVFTGETEALKELGVVMTQTALDEFALANGFGKTTNKMSEQEKVALRLAFVQDKLKTASGDFVRTQDQWANQTRILTGQFETLKSVLGQGLINVLLPVVKVLNTLMGKLIQLANMFKSFTDSITGNKSGGGGPGAVMQDVASAATDAAAATGGIEDASNGAAKAAKKAQKSLMGFDEINKLSSNQDSGTGAGSGAGSIPDFGTVDFGNLVADESKVASTAVNKVVEKMKELADIFKAGFKVGLGKDFEDSIERTKVHVQGIRQSLIDILTDPQIIKSASNLVNTFAYALGQAMGSIVSVAQTIAELLVGGIDKYLAQNKSYIKSRLIGILDVSKDYFKIAGELSQAVASIFEVFRGDTSKQIVADILGIFINIKLGVVELMAKLGRDILNVISMPIINNSDRIKTTLENILKPISVILSTLNNAVKETFDNLSKVYDEKLKPLFDSIAEGFSFILEVFLDAFNRHIAPILNTFAENFKGVWESDVQPAINKAIEVIGKLAELIQFLWENLLQPLIAWIVDSIIPYVAPVFEALGKIFNLLLSTVGKVVSGILDVLGGLIDFILGVLTGDWKRAWEGIKSILSGICNAIVSLLVGILGSIYELIVANLSQVKTFWTGAWNGLKTGVSTALSGVKSVFVTIFQGIWKFLKGIINTILGGIESMVNGVVSGLNSMIKALNKVKFKAPDWVPEIGGKSFGFNIPSLSKASLPRLAQGGYVRANQPQPVIVGDNKTQGEIISPEGKMLDVMLEALEQFFSKLQQSGYKSSSNDGGDIVIPIYLDGTLLDEVIVTAQQRRNLRSGGR